jgi:hypothetical protein
MLPLCYNLTTSPEIPVHLKISHPRIIPINNVKSETYLQTLQCSQYFPQLPCCYRPHLSEPQYALLLPCPTKATTTSEPCLTANTFIDSQIIAQLSDNPLLQLTLTTECSPRMSHPAPEITKLKVSLIYIQ